MNLLQLKIELNALDEAVEVGGFRQWIEEGKINKATKMLAVLEFCRQSPAPKSIKIITRVLKELEKQNLIRKEVLHFDAVPCVVCFGHGLLDDGGTKCPACDGEGLVLHGLLVPHFNWLDMVSQGYMKLTEKQRREDVSKWLDENELLLKTVNGKDDE